MYVLELYMMEKKNKTKQEGNLKFLQQRIG